MISRATQQLFADVFHRTELFSATHPIHRRHVAWGGERRVLPHEAVVADESTLLDLLPPIASAEGPADWTIHAAKPLPSGVSDTSFGDRTAHAAAVELRPGSDCHACTIESVDAGWLFLMPQTRSSAWLLTVGGDAESLLGKSRFIVPDIARITSAGAQFASHPRIAWPLCGARWLACGSGALAFDPICGDGSGNAIREAILAAAVVRAAHDNKDEGQLRQHYRTRLLAGFERHLQVCAEFYRLGGQTDWWRAQLSAADAGIAWCRNQLGADVRYAYRLNGFDLERVS